MLIKLTVTAALQSTFGPLPSSGASASPTLQTCSGHLRSCQCHNNAVRGVMVAFKHNSRPGSSDALTISCKLLHQQAAVLCVAVGCGACGLSGLPTPTAAAVVATQGRNSQQDVHAAETRIALTTDADKSMPTFLCAMHAACVLLPAAITATGLIWTRYSTQITPINYNLMSVNAFMACTGLYQLYRRFRYVHGICFLTCCSLQQVSKLPSAVKSTACLFCHMHGRSRS